MAEDRWNDRRYGDEPLWGDDRRRDQPRRSRDWGPEDYDRYTDDRPRSQAQDDTRYRPFGDTGPISTRSGAYSGDGRPYRAGGRYDEPSPNYREFELSQRRIHRGDYDPDRYTPNPREGRGAEPRSWWDRTQDEVNAWFGDEHARRRREWDEHQAEVRSERRESYSGLDYRPENRGASSGLDYAHRGRGPRGYKRSDSRIAEDINDRLTEDPHLDASDIEVSVQDGEATLSGFVARREDKRRAEDVAERISGVNHVQNNLRVKPESSIPTGDYIVP